MVRSQSGQIVHETLSRKNPSQKKGWSWVQIPVSKEKKKKVGDQGVTASETKGPYSRESQLEKCLTLFQHSGKTQELEIPSISFLAKIETGQK
jgi:hypothetical protein